MTLNSNGVDAEILGAFSALGLNLSDQLGTDLAVYSAIDGRILADLRSNNAADIDAMVGRAAVAFDQWKIVPAPVRGQMIRQYGELIRTHKEELARLLALENGKILTEARGEIQEVIDICDYAVGLSRQLFGQTIASERPEHRLTEYWHPMGVLGLISAFNFPAAVWAWGTTVALVCGNAALWKPSEKTPLIALAMAGLLAKVAEEFDAAPDHLIQTIIGGADCGQALAAHEGVAIVSATGSVVMGLDVNMRVAARFGRPILELGGNNATIIAPSADLDLALRGAVFAAIGTAGQRCTSLRRLIVHESVKDLFLQRLKAAYATLHIGNPLTDDVLVGPLIDQAAFVGMQQALEAAKTQGGIVHGGERVMIADLKGGYYVRPAIVEMPAQTAIVREETFAPILYVLSYRDFDEAIALQRGVSQGLSSSIFTQDVREAELFQSVSGSDCGIANVNIGTSGAEIGGAFGGEKVTGGGRVSGSDSWKSYMRRMTTTVNYSGALPLAQGVKFDLDL